MTGNLTWADAQHAIANGKSARRSVWITWVKSFNGRLIFDLPKDWVGGRRYRPTATDMASGDWEVKR